MRIKELFETKNVTIASATKPNGNINRKKADRILDPHGYFAKNKRKNKIKEAVPDDQYDWVEALEYPDPKSDVPVQQQIQHALQVAGAQHIELPGNHKGTYYTTDDKIIHVEGTFATVEDKENWIWDIDPENFYPEYQQEWNDDFWYSPVPLYHETTEENVRGIQQEGLTQQDKTRGLSNRGVGAVVFTTVDYESLGGSYGEYVFKIDTKAMAKAGYKPFVSQEPPVVEENLRQRIARLIGLDDFWSDVESGIYEETVIIYGVIPPQFLKLITSE